MRKDVPVGKDLVDPYNARGNPTYQEMMDKIAADGYQCPFCTWAVHPKPLLHRAGPPGHVWVITERHEIPEGIERYFLIVPGSPEDNRHIENFREMTTEDFAAVNELVEWAEFRFALLGFGLILRSGESHITGATVRHLHFHLIVPEIDLQTGRAKPYYFPIG